MGAVEGGGVPELERGCFYSREGGQIGSAKLTKPRILGALAESRVGVLARRRARWGRMRRGGMVVAARMDVDACCIDLEIISFPLDLRPSRPFPPPFLLDFDWSPLLPERDLLPSAVSLQE